MIFYFSATGNCKYISERIAKALSENIVSICDCLENNKIEYDIKKNEKVGIIIPTYFLGLPAIVKQFLDEIKLNNAKYIYFIATYGTTPGGTGYFAQEYFLRKNLGIDAYFSIKMPDTWTPVFNLSNTNKILQINTKAESEISRAIELIRSNAHGNYMKNQTPLLIAKLYHKVYYPMSLTSHLGVSDSCIGCGICAQKCPTHAIAIRNNKPVWVKKYCTMCLGCLHRCPKFAIQYGKQTSKHGQYKNPNTTI